MSIEREDIMRIVRASRKDRESVGDDIVMWLIIGGWALFVAVLSCLSELQQLIAGGAA